MQALNGKAPLEGGNTAENNRESLESRIGLYWLHRAGVAALVFGFAFLMMYSVQTFAPLLKIVTGVLASIALIGTGEFMARCKEKRWFGHGLAAGGWSLAYFSAYAAYYIAESKVISSLPLETGLLLGVAGGSMLFAVRARSELIAILSVALAGISILFSEPGLSGDISFLILAVSASILGNTQGWRRLFSFAMAICYFGHYYSSSILLGSAASAEDRLFSALMVSFIWLSFSMGIGYYIRGSAADRSYSTTISYWNAACFSFGLFIFCKGLDPNILETILAAAGAVYMGMARWLRKREESVLSTVHFLLGLSLINGAKAMRFSGLEVLTLDVMQIWLLMVLGLKYDIRAFRLVGAYLSCTFIFEWLGDFNRTEYGALAIPAFGFRSIAHTKLALCALAAFSHIAVVAHKVSRTYEKFSYGAANILYSLASIQIESSSNASLPLILQSCVNLVLGLKLSEALYSGLGFVLFCGAWSVTLCSTGTWSTAAIGLAVVVFYAMFAIARSDFRSTKARVAGDLMLLAAYSGTTLLTLLLWEKMNSTYLSLAFGLEGLLLLSAAFLLKELTFRTQAFGVIAILVGKLLLFDFLNRGTVERIVSFLGAGVTLLLSSYVYGLGTNAFAVRPNVIKSEDETEIEAGPDVLEPDVLEPADTESGTRLDTSRVEADLLKDVDRARN